MISRLTRSGGRTALAAVIAAATLLGVAPAPAVAHHGDIHAVCVGNKPVIKERPPGTEHVTVICTGGLPEFMVNPDPVPTYNPVTQALPQAIPPDFGGWVTVWLNGHPLKTPYDPVRRIQEPGAYLSASTGRVMMPVRFFTEAFGGWVNWSQEEQRARLFLRGTLVQTWVGKSKAVVGAGHIVDLDQPPVLFQGRVFVPVRFLMESYGAKIQWDHANRSARVQLSGATCSNQTYCGEVR